MTESDTTPSIVQRVGLALGAVLTVTIALAFVAAVVALGLGGWQLIAATRAQSTVLLVAVIALMVVLGLVALLITALPLEYWLSAIYYLHRGSGPWGGIALAAGSTAGALALVTPWLRWNSGWKWAVAGVVWLFLAAEGWARKGIEAKYGSHRRGRYLDMREQDEG